MGGGIAAAVVYFASRNLDLYCEGVKMEKLFDGLKKGLETIMAFLMLVMTVTIFVATVSRFTGLFVINWAEELARYSMIWIIFLGVGAAALTGEHFCVEALGLFLPQKILKGIGWLNALLIFGFNVIVARFGMDIIKSQMASRQISPSLNWPMWVIYLAIPVGLTAMGVGYAYHSGIGRKQKAEGKETE